MDRTSFERILGDAAAFVITPDNRATVQDWAMTLGYAPAQVRDMSSVTLANLYHEYGPQTRQNGPPAIAAAILATIDALRAVPPSDDAIRAIVREELDALAPRRIVVETQRGSVTLDGTQHYQTARAIRIVGRNHPLMMVGPAGCGKTTIAQHIATALSLEFYITSAVNDTHELMGFIDGYGKYQITAFRRAYENGGVWCADEIDAWDASALLVANSAIANGVATFPDVETPVRRHSDFRICATANTFGTGADRVYVGRTELDAASLDRFAVLSIDYDLTLERYFAAGQDRWLDHVWSVRETVERKKIRHVVSSRAVAMGAAALIDGETWDDVEEMYLLKGMSAADRGKL